MKDLALIYFGDNDQRVAAFPFLDQHFRRLARIVIPEAREIIIGLHLECVPLVLA